MSEHRAEISWALADGSDFRAGRYPRLHAWRFDGGITVPASPSPAVVLPPWSTAAAVDPEEAFVASIASCHMLTFLWLASRAGHEATRYDDRAVGTMTRGEGGVPWVSRVVLAPRIAWARAPARAELERLHREAHAQCFIAASVRTEIVVASPDDDA